MPSNHTALIDYWGFKCPKGSKFYICEDTWAEFLGCCTKDPCADGSGMCLLENVRPASFEVDKYASLPAQDCLTSSSANWYTSSSANWYTCAYTDPPFIGCCDTNACSSGCSSPGIGGLSQIPINRRDFLNPDGLGLTNPPSEKTSLDPVSTLPPSPFATSLHSKTSSPNTALMRPVSMAGMCIALLTASIICIGLVTRYCNILPSKANHDKSTYFPIISQDAVERSGSSNGDGAQTVNHSDSEQLASVCKPRNLEQRKATASIRWIWNIVLALIPWCFIALAIAVVDLDGQTESSYGQNVLELTRLGPSLYPILFAAIAGRFYKNLARWSLEQPGGIRLAVLEQVFGSQSFVTAFERVFVVHTHVFLSVLILSTWVLSPLGGQSSSRILSFANGTEVSDGTISYLNPAYQVSSYINRQSFMNTRGSVAALYSSSLLASFEQKRSPRDMWELPKIPQWKPDKKAGETYLVDQEALDNGTDYYASLLGIKVRGLDFSNGLTRYNFTVQTSYINLQCSLANDSIDISDVHFNNAAAVSVADQKSFGVVADIKSPLPWTEWKGLDSPPPLQLRFFNKWSILDPDGESTFVWSAINCTMQTIWIETELHCGPSPTATSCYAYQQRRVNNETSPYRLPRLMTKNHGALRQAISVWPQASGETVVNKPSATENYIMGEIHPFAGQDFRNWTALDRELFPKKISQRLTTAFNTFWDATLNPVGHTNRRFRTLDDTSTAYEDDFNAQPFMNSTIGTMTVNHEVYRASQLWIAILLTATLFLQILAILGLVLEVLIVGPEVLGYASSLTRDNPYVPLPTAGSGLDGPERSRVLRDLRLQLADVRPNEDIGYIVVRAIPTKAVDEITEQGSIELMNRDAVSGQTLWGRLDSKRLYR